MWIVGVVLGEKIVVCARVMSEGEILNLAVSVTWGSRRGEVEGRRRWLYKPPTEVTTGWQSTRDDLIVV